MSLRLVKPDESSEPNGSAPPAIPAGAAPGAPAPPPPDRSRLMLAGAALGLVLAGGAALVAWSKLAREAEGLTLTMEFKTPSGTRTTAVTGTRVQLSESRGGQLSLSRDCELSVLQLRELRRMSEPLASAPRGKRAWPHFTLTLSEGDDAEGYEGDGDAALLEALDAFVINHASGCIEQNLTPLRGVKIE